MGQGWMSMMEGRSRKNWGDRGINQNTYKLLKYQIKYFLSKRGILTKKQEITSIGRGTKEINRVIVIKIQNVEMKLIIIIIGIC